MVGATPTRPGSCGHPLPGYVGRVLRDDGSEAATGELGALTLAQPFPSPRAHGVGRSPALRADVPVAVSRHYVARRRRAVRSRRTAVGDRAARRRDQRRRPSPRHDGARGGAAHPPRRLGSRGRAAARRAEGHGADRVRRAARRPSRQRRRAARALRKRIVDAVGGDRAAGARRRWWRRCRARGAARSCAACCAIFVTRRGAGRSDEPRQSRRDRRRQSAHRPRLSQRRSLGLIIAAQIPAADGRVAHRSDTTGILPLRALPSTPGIRGSTINPSERRCSHACAAMKSSALRTSACVAKTFSLSTRCTSGSRS